MFVLRYLNITTNLDIINLDILISVISKYPNLWLCLDDFFLLSDDLLFPVQSSTTILSNTCPTTL